MRKGNHSPPLCYPSYPSDPQRRYFFFPFSFLVLLSCLSFPSKNACAVSHECVSRQTQRENIPNGHKSKSCTVSEFGNYWSSWTYSCDLGYIKSILSSSCVKEKEVLKVRGSKVCKNSDSRCNIPFLMLRGSTLCNVLDVGCKNPLRAFRVGSGCICKSSDWTREIHGGRDGNYKPAVCSKCISIVGFNNDCSAYTLTGQDLRCTGGISHACLSGQNQEESISNGYKMRGCMLNASGNYWSSWNYYCENGFRQSGDRCVSTHSSSESEHTPTSGSERTSTSPSGNTSTNASPPSTPSENQNGVPWCPIQKVSPL